MSPELEEKLVTNFPELFDRLRTNPTTNTRYYGCDVDDGWFQLVYQLCAVIYGYLKHERAAGREVAPVKVRQIKEKFGGLRFYSDGGGDFVRGAIELAEHLSTQTCEVTGRPGQLCRKPSGWLKTLCPEEAEKIQARPYADIICELEQAKAQKCAEGG
jgi:hypothetical protein